MELGVFSLTDIYPGSPDTAASRIDDIIGYGVLAEQSGLDVFGIGEHHTRAFAVSSPPWCTPRSPGRPAASP
jgi:alkanesulfonate monooxygenase SsuD/methylene tetrahydromethanopterin reductase-like flavin-dependent oxidoreductase (luciferase family)